MSWSKQRITGKTSKLGFQEQYYRARLRLCATLHPGNMLGGMHGIFSTAADPDIVAQQEAGDWYALWDMCLDVLATIAPELFEPMYKSFKMRLEGEIGDLGNQYKKEYPHHCTRKTPAGVWAPQTLSTLILMPRNAFEDLIFGAGNTRRNSHIITDDSTTR